MPSLQITMAGSTTILNLGWALMGAKPSGASYPPAAGGVTVAGQNPLISANVQFMRISHDPASAAATLYVGDPSGTGTSSDVGPAHHGDAIAKGSFREYWPTRGNSLHMAEKWIAFDITGGVCTVDFEIL